MKKNLSLREIQLKELNILKEVVKILEKHNLKYSLCGGTLIGALRHKGFIPWDDDIDIFMPRPDYDKLIQLSSEIDDVNLKLCCYENGTGFLPICKIKDETIKIIDDAAISEGREQDNIWIDIFPIDALPDNLKQRKKLYKKYSIYRKLFIISRNKINFSNKKIFSIEFIKECIRVLVKPISKFITAKQLIKIATKLDWNNAKYVGDIVWGYGEKEMLNKSDFDDLIDIDFEGNKFKVIKNYDYYLKRVYGNYMELPPENERGGHGIKALEK